MRIRNPEKFFCTVLFIDQIVDEWLERLTANAVIATVPGSIQHPTGAADEAVLNIVHKKRKSQKIPLSIKKFIDQNKTASLLRVRRSESREFQIRTRPKYLSTMNIPCRGTPA
jgi:hypothetical protein